MSNQLQAGLIDDHVEFFTVGEDLFSTHQGTRKKFRHLPDPIHRRLRLELSEDPDAQLALEEWGIDDPEDQLEQFTWCRFGGADISPDLMACGKLQPDFHDCSRRGECPFEGRICINVHHITPREREVLIAIAQGHPQKVIASDLNITEVTVAKMRKSLFNKTGSQSSVDLTRFALQHNYIQHSYES